MSALTQRSPGVCGGEACAGMTRIAVRMLDEAISRNQVHFPSKFDTARSMSNVPGYARRAARGKAKDLAEILATVPDAPPSHGYECE